MEVSFKDIDFVAFSKIWNSNHHDKQPDSWTLPLEKTPEDEWKPVYERWNGQKYVCS